MALARLGEFTTAQQSGAIVIWMLPKLPGEKCERLRRIEVPELVECRRQLAAWADTVTTWVDPPIPGSLLNRDVDNWEPLLFVAQAAGGEWLRKAAEAAEGIMRLERQLTVMQRLMRSVWLIYQPDPEQDPTEFLPSKELRERLLNDPEEDWRTMGPAGREITYQWLRAQ